MHLRRNSTVKYIIAVFIGAALYCEWFVFLIQPLYWPKLECPTNDGICTKVLFIADPQIQGDMAVPPPLNTLFNWDSDKYLRSTFSAVIKHFKPEVLVYLGDLMDEGSLSTMPQFHGYVKRLSNIFKVDYPVAQIWIPGDNDIGGENEPIRKDKVEEFEKVFNQPLTVTFRNISFYKVNAITHTYPHRSNNSNVGNTRIVLSHYPITNKGIFAKQVNSHILPHIYFCAHEHESKFVKQDREMAHRQMRPLTTGTLTLSLDNDLYEIYVPTCSYRMGTSSIGYGVAVFDNNQHMSYTVLWSPTRFPYLIVYLLLIIILVLYFIVFCSARLFYRNNNFRRKDDKLYLLDRV